MVDEGALTVRLELDGSRVSSVRLASTRRTDVAKILTGLPVERALALVPSLFSICASAQAVAGLEACEAALGVRVDEANRALRRALVALEAIDNHAFQCLVEWPRVVSLGPDVTSFRAVRSACQGLRVGLIGARPWARVGGVELVGTRVDVGPLRAAMAAIPRADSTTDEALGSWSPFLARALDAGAQTLGGAATPLVPLEDAAWFARRLGDDGTFSAAPTVDGRPAEAGCLAFVASQPAVAAALAREGRTVWVRLLAQLEDAHRLVEVVEASVGQVAGGRPATAPGAGSGAGAGVADTSRGRLAHAVWVREGVVTSWRTVAPTEWSFHPRGVVKEVLGRLEAEAAVSLAPFLVASLDPCVACRVTPVKGTPRERD